MSAMQTLVDRLFAPALIDSRVARLHVVEPTHAAGEAGSGLGPRAPKE
jgi:hypothetical protein